MDDKKKQESKKEIIVSHKHKFNLFSIVFLILLTTKLLGISDISWFWVFSPFIFLLGLMAIFLGFAFIVAVLKELSK